MTSYVAMLRGINVGGRRRVAMDDLRRVFSDLGARNVRTYVQSGNVVFDSDGRPPELLAAAERRIGDDLGLDVSVLLRTAAQLSAVVGANPFVARGSEPRTLHVTFLSERPAAAGVSRLAQRAPAGPDEFEIVGSEVYVRCPDGYGRTTLNNAFFEKQLSVLATTRNWKSVTTLAEMAGA